MESQSIVNGTKINYRFQKGKYDRKHLLVIFSGFRKRGTYDFQGNVLSKLTANILWIDDSFDDNYSYYLRHRGGYDLTRDINQFIETMLADLGLTKADCTLAGFSKGGTAALYYLAQYHFQNAVVAVPQFFVGRYISGAWKECIDSMTNTGSQAELDKLDTLLPDAISNSDSRKNIYLFTSPADIQYKTEILPNLNSLRKFDNFNLVTTETPLVTRHNQVTKYNVPGIVSVLGLLAEGFSPVIGEVKNGAGYPEAISPGNSFEQLGTLRGSVNHTFIRNGRLFITGYALFEKHVSDRWGSQKTALIMTIDNEQLVWPLGQIVDESVNGKFYSEPFVNHSHASFATVGHKGIDITALADGRYSLGLRVSAHDHSEIATKLNMGNINEISYHNGKIYRLSGISGALTLIVQSLSSVEYSAKYFETVQNEVIDGRLYLKGYLVPHGADVNTWKSICYFAEVKESSGEAYWYYAIACDTKTDVTAKSGNYFNDQSKAFFATKGYKGVDLSNLPSGEYEIRILGIAENELIASPTLDKKIRIYNSDK